MKRERFLIHAVILAVAGFISRAVGLLYAIPLYHIIGEEGNGYYGTAYEIYNILLFITAYSMPMAISKIMSVYVAEKDYVNCKRLMRTCLFYVTLVGGIGAIFTYAFADEIVVAPAALSLKVMAPAIFFAGVLGVLRGYTQAHNTMVPTAISQIVQQIFNAVFSIFFAFILVDFTSKNGGYKILDFFGLKDTIPPVAYGAMGSALGILVGVLVALGFILIYIMSTKKKRREMYKGNTGGTPESYFTLFRVIFLHASPIILVSFLYNLSTLIDMVIFWNWTEIHNYSQSTAASIFGIFSREYLLLINVPLTIASAISSSMMPGLALDFASNEVEEVKTRISRAVRSVVVFAVPGMVGLTLLARPIMQLLFQGTSKAASDALVMGSVSVLFFSVATVLNNALLAMGKSFIAIKNVVRALVIHVLYVVGMLRVSGSAMGILVTGSVIYSAAICFGNINSLEKYFGSKLRVLSLIGKPVIASVIMGIVTIVSISVLSGLGVGNFLGVSITIILSVVVYFIVFYFQDDYMDKGIFLSVKKRKG